MPAEGTPVNPRGLRRIPWRYPPHTAWRVHTSTPRPRRTRGSHGRETCRLRVLLHGVCELITPCGEFEQLVADRLNVEAARKHPKHGSLLVKPCNPFHCPNGQGPIGYPNPRDKALRYVTVRSGSLSSDHA